MKRILFISMIICVSFNYTIAQTYHELYRPQIHFSPKAHWMNDPNGMVYYNGIYHLFFQYYPGASVWGPMHWGHATSGDLLHWKEQPIALYPDKIGYIFSGSVVVDSNNTSGFGSKNKPPMVAIFTQHDTAGEHAHTTTFQNQSIAYSNDAGKSWTKYQNNPVLKNPGIADFRDPKVMWFADGSKWIMTLAVKDHIEFYSSPDLKTWTKESEFGKNIGEHDGVWECPDLFYFNDDDKKFWALLVSVNPGAPNGGSGTQYFIGDFDGKNFTPINNTTKWIDYGPDDYAGVTWSNTNNRKIYLGWMSNWSYAQLVPTQTWRSTMTIPRNLNITHLNNDVYISSKPVVELNNLVNKTQSIQHITVDKEYSIQTQAEETPVPCKIDFTAKDAKSFSVVFSNENNETLTAGYDDEKNRFFIDRTKSGETDFYQSFSKENYAPRISTLPNIRFALVVDVSSVELFADDGLSVMTEIFFSSKPFSNIKLKSNSALDINNLSYTSLRSAWK